jgi:RND superfamily putative drug exporter
VTVHGTSMQALLAGYSAGRGNSSVTTVLIIGALGALVILACVFGSLLALLPLVMALISVLTMQLFVYALTYLVPGSTPIDPAVQYIVALLGLGLSIDYALLVVSRWREEHAAGQDNAEAVRTAVKRAGRSVGFGGLVASLGLFALIVIPNSLVRGIGMAGLFIPSTAAIVALTLLPAVLSRFGPALDWPRAAARRSARGPGRFWTGWASLVIRNRVVAAAVGLGILAVLAVTATTLNIARPTAGGLSTAGDRPGLHAIEAADFPTGALTAVPVYVPRAANANAVVTSLDSVASLRGAVSPAGSAWHAAGSAMVIAPPAADRDVPGRHGTGRHPARRAAWGAGRRPGRAADRFFSRYLRRRPAAVRPGRPCDVRAARPRAEVGPAAAQGGAAQRAVRGRHLRPARPGLLGRHRHADAVGSAAQRGD